MEKIFTLLKKNKDILLYCIFGGFTTLINIISYSLCFYWIATGNTLANIISWIISVLFAYITNKLWVFESRSFQLNIVLKEMISFFGCRIITGLLDMLIMYIAVDKLGLVAWIFKIISNILVIILNYIASKLFIFKFSKRKD